MDLCTNCLDSLPQNIPACRLCGIHLPTGTPELCGPCAKRPPATDNTLALFRFEEPVRTLIHELKFGDRYSCSRLFAALLADAIGKLEHHPEVLIPVPLHWRRYQQREFNQSLEIARQLHEHLAIPLSTDHCRRIRHTTPQSDLSSAERRKNLKNAFHIVNPIPYSHAAIVDDVVTTATTVNEIAKTLKKSGVIRVDVFAVARA